MNKLKKQLYNVLFPTDHSSLPVRIFEFSIVTLIIMNIVVLMLETVQSIYVQHLWLFHHFDVVSVIIFSNEYILRLWVITEDPKYKHPVLGRLKYAFTPLAIFDFLSIFPFYLPFTGVDLRSFRILRLFRLFRIFKITRYITAIDMIRRVIASRREQLLISFGIVIFMLIIVSCVMFYVEHPAQPEVFSSIPATMWWGVATLTTVGYGDILPLTPLGKFLGALIAIMGVGLFAIPAGIMASGFSEELGLHRHRHGHYCPHCGERIDLEQ